MTNNNVPTDEDLLGCAGVSRGDGLPKIVGTADIRRFAECILKHFGQPAMPADSYPCKIIEADLESGVVTLQMQGKYSVSAGQKFLVEAPRRIEGESK